MFARIFLLLAVMLHFTNASSESGQSLTDKVLLPDDQVNLDEDEFSYAFEENEETTSEDGMDTFVKDEDELKHTFDFADNFSEESFKEDM